MKRSANKYDLSSRRRKRKINKIQLLVLAFFLLAASIIFLTRVAALRINNIEVSNGDQKIREAARAELNGNYFLVFPKDNIFYYPEAELKTKLLAEFPEVSNLELSTSFDKGLLINISPRVLAALWCSEQACYLMDNSGFLYAEATGNELAGYLKLKGLITGNPIGQKFGSVELFNSFLKFAKDLANLGIKVESFLYTDQDKATAYLVDGSYIIFTPDPKLEKETFDNISVFIKNLKTGFQYLDVRYGNKIFYKLK